MLKQFPLQLDETATTPSSFDILNLYIINGGPRYCYNLTVSVSFRVSLFFAWQRLWQETCKQSETFVHINSPTAEVPKLFAPWTPFLRTCCFADPFFANLLLHGPLFLRTCCFVNPFFANLLLLSPLFANLLFCEY